MGAFQQHEIDVDVAAACDRVLAIFAARPAAWLRPFLRLSAPGVNQAHLWYRLAGPSPGDTREVVSFPFIWWPSAGSRTFDRFRGAFTVSSGGTGSRLTLSGATSGGDLERNSAALATLMRLLAVAIETEAIGAETPGQL
jgi:hypothetical protein